MHYIAGEIKTIFENKYQEISKANLELLPEHNGVPELEVINGDFLTQSWEDASFIFANSTCFSPELMQNISKKADETKIGTVIVTFTKRLPNLSENWNIKEGFRRLMSWGIATVYVHVKTKDS